MSAVVVLAVIAIFQALFLITLVVFLSARRRVQRERESAFTEGMARVSQPLNTWLTGATPVDAFVIALRWFPGTTALGVTGNLARTSMLPVQRSALATALREEKWVRAAMSGARSRRWTRRLEAARCLALAGNPADGAVLELLLNDARPAVAIAAVNALPRVADERLVGVVLDRMTRLPDVVRVYLQDTLREIRPLVEPALIERLASPAPPRALARWLDLSAALELPATLEHAIALATHADVRVREAVARALRRAPTRRSADTLRDMLRDEEASVRSAAAHALGELSSPVAIPALVAAVHDNSWLVRYHATLALAQLGERGRAAVRTLRTDGDRYVADMATLIAGLGDGALLDMAQG